MRRTELILFSKLRFGPVKNCMLCVSAYHYSRYMAHLNIAEVSNILMISLAAAAAARAVDPVVADHYQTSARQVARHFLSPKGPSNEMILSTVAAEDEEEDGICKVCKMFVGLEKKPYSRSRSGGSS